MAKSKSTFSAWGFDKTVAGLFTTNNGEVTFFANADRFSSGKSGKVSLGRQIVLHEMVHLLMNNSELSKVWAMPPWYTEGIAEYFGTYVERKGQIYLGDMSLVGNRFYSMWRGGGGLELIDVAELLTDDYRDKQGSSRRSDQRFVEKFYARSFALVHYLNADPERRKKMFQYLIALKKGFTVQESFDGVFEMTYEELDHEVDSYLNGRYVSVRVFKIGKGGVEFPAFETEVKKVKSRLALTHMVSKLQQIADPYLSDDDKQEMYVDLEKIYPDFFAQ